MTCNCYLESKPQIETEFILQVRREILQQSCNWYLESKLQIETESQKGNFTTKLQLILQIASVCTFTYACVYTFVYSTIYALIYASVNASASTSVYTSIYAFLDWELEGTLRYMLLSMIMSYVKYQMQLCWKISLLTLCLTLRFRFFVS